MKFNVLTGNPVSSGKRSSPEHPRRHCTVPLQRRGAQQNSHRGLLRGTVSAPVFLLFSFHPSFSTLHLHCLHSDTDVKLQEVASLDLWSRAVTGDRATKIAEGTCGSYRRVVEGGRTVEATWVSRYLVLAARSAVCLKAMCNVAAGFYCSSIPPKCSAAHFRLLASEESASSVSILMEGTYFKLITYIISSLQG